MNNSRQNPKSRAGSNTIKFSEKVHPRDYGLKLQCSKVPNNDRDMERIIAQSVRTPVKNSVDVLVMPVIT